MPLENLTGNRYIDSLVSSNPTSPDDRYEGDNHIRGIKNVLKKSFPLIAGPVDADHDALSGMKDYDGGAGTVGPRITTLETDVSAHIGDSDIHFADAPDPNITYGRKNGSWVPISGGGSEETLDITTAGASTTLDLDHKVYRDAGGRDVVVDNERMTYNILGSTEGYGIKVKIDGVITANNIAMVGRNGLATGWVSTEGIIGEKINQGDSRWEDPNFTLSAVIEFIEDTGSAQTLIGTRTARITKETILPGTSTGEVLTVRTAGTNQFVDLDYVIYRDGTGDHEITNEMASYNVFGSESAYNIEVVVDKTTPQQSGAIAVVGPNGRAHGWVSAKTVIDFMIQAGDSSFAADNYTSKSAWVKFNDDDRSGNQRDIPTHRVESPWLEFRITKKTVVAVTGGTLCVNTAGDTDFVDLDFKIYTDDNSSHTFTNDEASFTVEGSFEGALIKAEIWYNSINYGLTNTVAVVGPNGEAHGWISAQGAVDEAISRGIPAGWTDPSWVRRIDVKIVEENPSNQARRYVTNKMASGAYSDYIRLRITKTTDLAQVAPVKTALFAWHSAATQYLDVTLDARGQLLSSERLSWYMQGQAPNQNISMKFNGVTQNDPGDTNASGIAIGEVNGAQVWNFRGRPTGSGQVAPVTCTLTVANVVVASQQVGAYVVVIPDPP